MKSKLAIISLFYFYLILAQPIQDLNNSVIQEKSNLSGSFSYVDGKDSVVFSLQNGALDGKYRRYHEQKLVSSGSFANHHRVGRWLLKHNDNHAKLILYFSPRGYVFLKKVCGINGSFVLWGRGHVRYNFSKQMEEQFTVDVKGKAKIRYGTKEGKVEEYYKKTDQKYSISYFRRGLYEGQRIIFYPNGIPAFQGLFVHGSPKGEVRRTYIDGTAYVQVYDKDNTSFFIDQTEIIDFKTFYIYIDTSFASYIFRTDDGKTWAGKMDTWFKSGNLSTYADPMLKRIYFATSSQPDISGLSINEGTTNNVRGMLIKYKSFWLAQTWQHYDVPIALQWVSTYQKDSMEIFYGGPWIYLPLLYQSYPEVKTLFSQLQQFQFPFLYFEYDGDAFKLKPHGWIQKICWEEDNWWKLFIINR